MNSKAVIPVLGILGLWIALPVSAQSFNSALKYKVFEKPLPNEPAHLLGFTPAPAGKGVSVPSGTIWYVRPLGPLRPENLAAIAKDVQNQSIPGLDFSDRWDVGDEQLQIIESLPALRVLLLRRTRVSDEGLAHLKNLKDLRVVSISAPISNIGVAMLSDFTRLQTLDLSKAKVSDTGLVVLSNFRSLENLNLSGTHATLGGLSSLSLLPRLKSLVLGENFNDSSADALTGLHTLEELDLSETEISSSGMRCLSGLPLLKRLYLNKVVGDSGMAYLEGHDRLEKLDLSGSQLTDIGMVHLKGLTQLRELALAGTMINDDGIRMLSGLTRLEILDVSSTQVTPEGLESLASLPRLRTVSFSGGELTEPAMRSLSRLVHLQKIVLNGTPLSARFFSHIQAMAKMPAGPSHRTAKEPAGTAARGFIAQKYAAPLKPRPGTLRAMRAPPLLGLKRLREMNSDEEDTSDVTAAGPPRAQSLDEMQGSGPGMDIEVGVSSPRASKHP